MCVWLSTDDNQPRWARQKQEGRSRRRGLGRGELRRRLFDLTRRSSCPSVTATSCPSASRPPRCGEDQLEAARETDFPNWLSSILHPAFSHFPMGIHQNLTAWSNLSQPINSPSHSPTFHPRPRDETHGKRTDGRPTKGDEKDETRAASRYLPDQPLSPNKHMATESTAMNPPSIVSTVMINQNSQRIIGRTAKHNLSESCLPS